MTIYKHNSRLLPRDYFRIALNAARETAAIDERFRLTDRAWEINDPLVMTPDDVAANKKPLLALYEEMARAGHAGAMRACAMIYFSGEIDGKPDHAAGLSWCEKAAEAGNESARKMLPEMQKYAVAPK